MRPIRIAAQLHPQHGDYRALRAAVAPGRGRSATTSPTPGTTSSRSYGDRDGAHLECWTMLAAWAEATERIEIGPLVSCIPTATRTSSPTWPGPIDRISSGRFVLGLGSGWFRRDFAEYDYAFGTAGSRLRALEAAVAADRRPARSAQPATGPPAAAPHRRHRASGCTLRLVAEHADGWHAGFPDRPDRARADGRRPASLVRDVGRDPADIEWGVGVEPDDLERFLAEDARDLRRDGLQPVHPRVQRSGLGGRPGRPVAGLARRPQPLPADRGRTGRCTGRSAAEVVGQLELRSPPARRAPRSRIARRSFGSGRRPPR